MSQERATEIALQLLRLGVSKAGVEGLMRDYPYDEIERQLNYLPYRKAKRPDAFIVEAVRRNYSAPKELFHAKNSAHAPRTKSAVDQDAQPTA
jgi:hypothetical protein